MIILGLNAFHGDSAAALVRDDLLVAAAEEERFRRVKHWAGFPSNAIAYCLREAGLSLADVDHIAVNQSWCRGKTVPLSDTSGDQQSPVAYSSLQRLSAPTTAQRSLP
jgi:predicted NodU family carbamoyl transferase